MNIDDLISIVSESMGYIFNVWLINLFNFIVSILNLFINLSKLLRDENKNYF